MIHLQTMSPATFIPKEDPAPQYHDSQGSLAENLCCPICTVILDRPLQLSCGAVVCLNCCCKWVQFAPSLSCPCCYGDMLNSSTVQLPSSLLMNLLQDLLVNCKKGCGKVVRLVQYQQHLNANCRSHYDQLTDSPSKMTIKDVLAKPTTSPATPAEVRVAEHLVRRILDQDTAHSTKGKGVLKVRTRGQVSKTINTKHR